MIKHLAGRAAAACAAAVLLVQPVTACAAEDARSERQLEETAAAWDPEGAFYSRDTSDDQSVSHSLSGEELDALLDFVKEKWDAGELDGEDAIYKAIEEGEEAFGVTLEDSVRDQIADGVAKLDELGLNHDTVIDLAKKLYREHGDKITESFQELYGEYADALADSVEEAIERQIVEPAKEAALDAVENTARTFWQDLKDSVVSFFKNIFS